MVLSLNDGYYEAKGFHEHFQMTTRNYKFVSENIKQDSEMLF